jgi:hypothetical protein
LYSTMIQIIPLNNSLIGDETRYSNPFVTMKD